MNLKNSVDAILEPSSNCYGCTNDCSATHKIGEIPNNSCKCLWIQVGAELAGVQLLFFRMKPLRGKVQERIIFAAAPENAASEAGFTASRLPQGMNPVLRHGKHLISIGLAPMTQSSGRLCSSPQILSI
jgi:hypothetical protein